MVQAMFIGTLIAMVLVTVHQSKAVAVSDITCTTDGNECTDTHSECDTSITPLKCKCSDGYKEDLTDKSTCVANVIADNECTPGDAITGNTKCQGVDPNAECSTDKCACTSDHFLSSDKTQCVLKITSVTCTPAHATDGDTKCQQADADSECKTGGNTCSCKGGYSGIDSCAKVLSGPCNAAGDCTGSVANSVCSTDNKCECAANYIEESAICKTAFGQACSKDEDCVSNAECTNECECLSGFTNSNGLCVAESSATSAWMASSLLVTSLLIYLPTFVLW